MAITIKRAVKHEAKLRMALAGPSGSGKTYTSLVLAHALADNGRVIIIDTERGSASKYADIFPPFDVIDLETFSPENYIEAIHTAEQAGYEVLIIDSISHEWTGPGGMLEIVETITKRKQSSNSFTSWGEATPRHNRLIEAITRARLHVLVTMRSKQEYILEKDERTGKTSPRKVGMAPIQRDGFEYETDLFCELDHENTLIIQKSRCPTLSGQVITKPDGRVADVLKAWLQGETPPPVQEVAPSEVAAAKAAWASAYHIKDEQVEARWPNYKVYALGVTIPDPDLRSSHLAKINQDIETQKNKTLATSVS